MTVMMSCKQEAVETKKIVRPVKIEKLSYVQQSAKHISLPASVNELSDTKLSFRVGGPLVMLNNVEGDYIEAGEVIARIDQRDFEIGIEATKSAFELTEAEYERYKNLVAKESVSQSAFDQMETQYKISKTNYESALNALKDTEIRAPFSGYINTVFVNNFEAVAPGQPIISLLDMSKFEINAWISVSDVASITDNTVYTCIVNQGGKEFRIPGKLKEIGTKTSPSKQSLPVTIIIDASEDVKLHAGVTTYLEMSTEDTLALASVQVPLSSLFTKNSVSYVWLYNDKASTVSAKQITTGQILENGKMEVLKGLQGNEIIVVAGTSYLFEGQEVKKMESFSKSNVGNKL